MGLVKRNKPTSFCRLMISISFFFVIIFTACSFFISLSTSFTTTCLDIRCQLSAKADLSFQEIKKRDDGGKHIGLLWRKRQEDVTLSLGRRLLSGLGSSPPHCASKCGKCTPCTPVHVPVPPGTPVTAEYYPEAWRCKCGNKFYMP